MKLLIADDHTLFRDALFHYIRRLEPKAELVLTASLLETVACLKSMGPMDLVLLDFRMPGMTGLEGLALLRDQFPAQRFALMSGVAEEGDVMAALKMGAVAYFPKTMSGASLVRAIHVVVGGERFVPLVAEGGALMPSYLAKEPPHNDEANQNKTIIQNSIKQTLSMREREVLEHIMQGKSNQDIADALDLQLATIKLHVRSICKKLNAKNRTHAAMIAQSLGLLPRQAHRHGV